jgi:hypothetical protein
MYKLTVTKQEDNPDYDPNYRRGYSDSYEEELNKKPRFISTTHLEVTLTDDEYEAIKKAVLSIK